MKLMMLIKKLKAVIHDDFFLEQFYYHTLLSELMASSVTYLIYSECWPDYTIYFIKYLGGVEVVIIYKVFSVCDICDTMTSVLEVIPDVGSLSVLSRSQLALENYIYIFFSQPLLAL